MGKRKIAVILLLASLLAAGCQRQQWEEATEADDTEQGAEVSLMKSEENEENLLQEYYALLMTTKEKEDVYRFLEKHAAGAEPKDADQLVNGLIGYLTDVDAVDYNRLVKQKNNFTVEMQEFIELMKQEQNTPAVFGSKINVPLSELLLRVEQMEEHARKYPEGITYQYIYEKYCQLMCAGITGFYDGASDWSNCYLDTDQLHIEEAAVLAYTDFTAAYPDSYTSDILQEYLNLLSENDRLFTKQVKKFYGRIESVIKENFPVE